MNSNSRSSQPFWVNFNLQNTVNTCKDIQRIDQVLCHLCFAHLEQCDAGCITSMDYTLRHTACFTIMSQQDSRARQKTI